MEEDQYVVTSALRIVPFAKAAVENIIQLRSRVESLGNAVFTLAVLRRFEAGVEFTEQFMSQSCVSACMRSMCSRGTWQRTYTG